MPTTDSADRADAAYREGRRVGLATAALALSAVAYLNLLGIEKSALAIVFAWLALSGAGSFSTARFRSRVALVLAAIHFVTVVVVVIVFREKLTELGRRVVELVHQLS